MRDISIIIKAIIEQFFYEKENGFYFSNTIFIFIILRYRKSKVYILWHQLWFAHFLFSLPTSVMYFCSG